MCVYLIELQILKNFSPQNFRDLVTCLTCPQRWGFNSVSSLPLPSGSPGWILDVIPGSLQAQQSVDAFTYAVPPRMEKGLDSRHILIGSGRD